MTDETNTVIVMEGPSSDLERVATRLERGGVASAIIPPTVGKGSS